MYIYIYQEAQDRFKDNNVIHNLEFIRD